MPRASGGVPIRGLQQFFISTHRHLGALLVANNDVPQGCDESKDVVQTTLGDIKDGRLLFVISVHRRLGALLLPNNDVPQGCGEAKDVELSKVNPGAMPRAPEMSPSPAYYPFTSVSTIAWAL
ncbi:uncharacterized protein LOC125945327 [Dermacentor silvarum]|uniref:uncharacterized protein LOC125945327 n=1 Tax=Dermacentor silvarum TaxID=543639 RepID=UPI002100AA04|nr:uncharacterized protein LOC125945327 [Dermacentor silvarum]